MNIIKYQNIYILISLFLIKDIQLCCPAPKNPKLLFPTIPSMTRKPALRPLEPHVTPAKARPTDERSSCILSQPQLSLRPPHNPGHPLTGLGRKPCGDPLPIFMNWITEAKSVYSPKAVDRHRPIVLKKILAVSSQKHLMRHFHGGKAPFLDGNQIISR